METFNPGYCTIEGASLVSHTGETVNISALVNSVLVNQSMGSMAVSVDMNVLDSVGLLHNFPIRGEELVYLSLKSHDLQTKVSLKLRLVKVINLVQSGDKVSYTIQCITTSSYDASLKNIITAFRDKSAEYCVTQLFKKNYGKITKQKTADTATIYKFDKDKERVFVAEESEGVMRVTIPDYAPATAMSFLARKAYSRKSLSSMFRFFETIKGYFWVTDEWLLQNGKAAGAKSLHYAPGTTIPLDPREGILITQSIEKLDSSNHIDTMGDIDGGGYKNTVIEIDLTRHTKTVYNYDYLKSKGKYKGMGGIAPSKEGQKHSDDFIKKTFTSGNSVRNFVIRDWAPSGFEAKDGMVPREDQFMAEIASNRIAYNYHLTNSSVTVSMKGRLDIQPGDIINLTVQEPDVSLSAKMNSRKSGLYLVFSTTHGIENEQLNSSFSLVKYDWDKG
jgi:hypothetical protein|tara:strand:- start:978 stop:2318 length:1341 start_codon:yes stop_codon:yes gene_type:complete